MADLTLDAYHSLSSQEIRARLLEERSNLLSGKDGGMVPGGGDPLLQKPGGRLRSISRRAFSLLLRTRKGLPAPLNEGALAGKARSGPPDTAR
jgi:hypothetical protein